MELFSYQSKFVVQPSLSGYLVSHFWHLSHVFHVIEFKVNGVIFSDFSLEDFSVHKIIAHVKEDQPSNFEVIIRDNSKTYLLKLIDVIKLSLIDVDVQHQFEPVV